MIADCSIEGFCKFAGIDLRFLEEWRTFVTKTPIKEDKQAYGNHIINTVQRVFKIDDIREKTKYPEYVAARKIASIIIKQENLMTLSKTAVLLGVDHPTVIYYNKTAAGHLEVCKEFRKMYLNVKSNL